LETLIKPFSETFVASAYESSLKSYGRYFDSLPLETELSVINSPEEFLKINISQLLKYLIPLNLSTELQNSQNCLPCYQPFQQPLSLSTGHFLL
jgi:hypothetical protein